MNLITADDKAGTRERIATIRVTARVDWLTNGGEGPEEAGWEELQEQIDRHLRHFAIGGLEAHMPKLSFIEWIEDPETP